MTAIWKSPPTITCTTPKKQKKHHHHMNSPTGGSVDQKNNSVHTKNVHEENHSHLMIGPCMHLGGQVVPSNVSRDKAHCTKLLFAILTALSKPGRRNILSHNSREIRLLSLNLLPST